MGPKSQFARRNRQSAAANSINTASGNDQPAAGKKTKDDYPVIVLTNTNLSYWLLGLKTAARSYIRGSEDLLHIIDTGEEPGEIEAAVVAARNFCSTENNKSQAILRQVKNLEK